MVKGQMLQSQNDIPAARATYAAGVKECPKDVRLWILSSRLEEADDKRIMARALLNKARLANHNNELLWAESVLLEERAGQPNQAKSNLARGECITRIQGVFSSYSASFARMSDLWFALVDGDYGRTQTFATQQVNGCTTEARR